MGFIKRKNLESMPFIENILNIQIIDITTKIGVPIIFRNSLNTLTKYKGNDVLEMKKLKSRNDKLKKFLKIIKKLHKTKEEAEIKHKHIKIVKVVISKSNNICFMYKKK